jgi:hypothetical protein
MTNIPEINEKVFQVSELPGFRFQKAPEPQLAAVPNHSPPVVPEVLACETVWIVQVAPCGRVGRRVCGPRSGLFRKRNAGYKCATAGLVPVLVQVSGVQ